MLDTIKNIFRHPIMDPHPSGEWQRPWATFRPYRAYAGDRVGYIERVICTYDFAVHGGAVGAINLNTVSAGPPLGYTFPDNATVVDGLIVVDTAPDSAGDTATIAIGGTAGIAANGLKAATAQATFAADATLPLIPLGHGTGEVKSTATGSIAITVAAEALTAGKFYILLDVFVTNG